jgi:hypothetical protein
MSVTRGNTSHMSVRASKAELVLPSPARRQPCTTTSLLLPFLRSSLLASREDKKREAGIRKKGSFNVQKRARPGFRDGTGHQVDLAELRLNNKGANLALVLILAVK